MALTVTAVEGSFGAAGQCDELRDGAIIKCL